MQRSIDIVGTGSSEYNERYALLLEKEKGASKALAFLEKAVVDGAYSSGMKKHACKANAGSARGSHFICLAKIAFHCMQVRNIGFNIRNYSFLPY